MYERVCPRAATAAGTVLKAAQLQDGRRRARTLWASEAPFDARRVA